MCFMQIKTEPFGGIILSSAILSIGSGR